MPERRVASSLLYLGLLVALAMVTAIISLATIFVEADAQARAQAEASTGGSSGAGRAAIQRHGCGSCHVILGVAGANGVVGPDLTHIGVQSEIAGLLPNDPQAMTRWLMHPQAIAPGNGMPDQGVSERDARDIAAYLYAHGR